MRRNLISLVALIVWILSSCENEAGMRGAINHGTVKEMIKFIVPKVAEKLKDVAIPDISTKVDVGPFKINVFVSEMHIGVTRLSPDLIIVEFVEPNIIHVALSNIQAIGHFKARFKCAFISDTEYVDLKVNSISVNMNLALGMREKEGRLLPDASFASFDLGLDFDFDLHGSAISGFINLLKPAIKSSITSQIINTVRSQSKEMLKQALAKLPTFLSLDDKGMAVDYALLSNPKVANGFLLFNSRGGIVNTKIPETLEPHYPFPTNLPEYQTDGKHLQFMISDYSINTALYTMYKSNLLQFTFKPEMIPEKIPIKLTTQWFEVIVWGITKVYGKDKLVEVELKVFKEPVLLFDEKVIQVRMSAEVSVNVRMGNNALETAVKVQTEFVFDVDFHVVEQGRISAFIHELKLENTQMIYSNVPTASALAMESEFNILAFVLKPILNAYVIKTINIKLPVIQGVNFSDSTVEHKAHYIAVNVNISFEARTFALTSPVLLKHLNRVKINCGKGKVIQHYELIEMGNNKYSYEYSCTSVAFLEEKQHLMQSFSADSKIKQELIEIEQYLDLF